MADEQAPADASPDDAQVANDATPSGKEGDAGTPKSFTQAEVDAIVKERLDRAQAKAKKDAEKAQADAEAKTKAEQGDYKALWETEKAKREAADTRAEELEIAGLRRDAAAKYNLPAGFADRLKGKTLEELEADAKVVAEMLPKPGAPNVNSGSNGNPPTGDAVKAKEYATRLGFKPEHWPQSNG